LFRKRGKSPGGREIVAALAERGRRRAPHSLEVDQAEPTRSATASTAAPGLLPLLPIIGRPLDLPGRPEIGYRATNALIAHGEAIVLPPDATEKVQYEGELVVVIGKKAKRVSESEALSCVLGYTIGNDASERTWQGADRTFWRSKNTDTFKPMGPWIETDVDLESMHTTVRLNGTTMIRFRTNDMLFGIAQYISAMSRYLTLFPGDVIWMGTDGVPANMKAGDEVEIEISGIGTLSNPIVLES
jgi:2-keto-4-pentenoate hydratase/2-oxohepta-3-ene-1,7-dioic acid hydratase in catechol pathway